VILKKGTGKRTVNGKDFNEHFTGGTRQMIIDQPLTTLGANEEWDVVARVRGGGISGQAGAVLLGIARALVSSNEENKAPMREGGFLTRDARVVQRKMYGRAKARKRFQFSKR
jgi:small subunit ribosomal protein S9